MYYTYRPFSIDEGSDQRRYWSTCLSEDMKKSDDGDNNDKHIEPCQPHEKVVLEEGVYESKIRRILWSI